MDNKTSRIINDQSIKDLVNQMCNYETIYNLYLGTNIDNQYLSLLNLDRTELLKARVILDKLTGLAAKLEAMNSNFDIEKIEQVHKV